MTILASQAPFQWAFIHLTCILLWCHCTWSMECKISLCKPEVSPCLPMLSLCCSSLFYNFCLVLCRYVPFPCQEVMLLNRSVYVLYRKTIWSNNNSKIWVTVRLKWVYTGSTFNLGMVIALCVSWVR